MKRRNIRRTTHLKHTVIIVGAVAVCLAGMFVATKPVFAQNLVGQILEIFKIKAGFQYTNDSSEFVFSKDTPNYTAFAGDRATGGGHRVMITKGGESVEFRFLSASIFAQSTGSAGIAAVAGVSTDSATFSPADIQTLKLAEQILSRQASASAEASVSATVIDETGITSDERQLLASASAILFASDSGHLILSQEQTDFLLYVALQKVKIDELARAVDQQFTVVEKEVSEIVSKAKLVEETIERKVVFSGIVSGVDIAYRLDEGGVEQQLVIGSAESMKNEFTFELATPSLTHRDIGNGVWYFFDASGSAVFRLPKGWATDGNKAFTNDVTQQIRKVNGKLQLIFTAPLSWLTAKERVYPIVIHTALEVIPEKRVGFGGRVPTVVDIVSAKNITATESAAIASSSATTNPSASRSTGLDITQEPIASGSTGLDITPETVASSESAEVDMGVDASSSGLAP